MQAAKAFYERLRELIHELLKYGVVGSAAVIVDVATFNQLQYGWESAPLEGHPLYAKVV
jgi:putative flippase GtrA